MSQNDKKFEVQLIEERYEKIVNEILDEVQKVPREHLTWSDILDHVFLNKWLGIPIFIVILWAMFQFVFTVSAPFMELIGMATEAASEAITNAVAGTETWLQILGSFFADGIIGGIGFLASFIPLIFALYIFLSILEDSGYMSRAAFVMDRAMVKVGLHGKSFVPMLMGFGCNIPAIMACRTISDETDRKITILINPLMSCGARLPVYTWIAATFFPLIAGTVIFSMYLLGIFLAIILALIFRKILFKSKPPAPFVIELPPYRSPTLKSTAIHMWEHGVIYVKRVYTILLGASIIIWAITHFPWNAYISGNIQQTFAGVIGGWIAPVFYPLGFTAVESMGWIIGIALIFGFLAKELVAEVIGVTIGVSAMTLFTNPVIAYSFMAFTLIYVPCMACMGVLKSELRSKKWFIFSMTYSFFLAYLVSFLISGIAFLGGII